MTVVSDEPSIAWSCLSQALEGAQRGVPLGLLWGSVVGALRLSRVWQNEKQAERVTSSDFPPLGNNRSFGLKDLWRFRAPRPFVYPSHRYVSIVFASAVGRSIEFGAFTAQYYGFYCLLDQQAVTFLGKKSNSLLGNTLRKVAPEEWVQNPHLIAATAGAASGISTFWLKYLLLALRYRFAHQWVSDMKPLPPWSWGYLWGATTFVGALSAAVCYAVEAFRE
jgi:hypothetical protein